jgi:response regulator RpfG family c-di-GMP phosphodiesterase
VLEVRIVAVENVYEAMTAHRPYRPKHTQQAALLELEKNADTLYDPDVVEHCAAPIKSRRFHFPKLQQKIKLFSQKKY